jgi:hypothetical protein
MFSGAMAPPLSTKFTTAAGQTSNRFKSNPYLHGERRILSFWDAPRGSAQPPTFLKFPASRNHWTSFCSKIHQL